MRRHLITWAAMVPTILLLAGGCAQSGAETAAPPAPDKPIAHRDGLPLQDAASFGRKISLVQSVEGRYEGLAWEMLTQIEIDDTRLAVAALSPLGLRLFSVVLEGGEITYTPGAHPLPPIEPRTMLADIQAALWPGFPEGNGWQYREEVNPCCMRIFSRGGAEPVITVAYDSNPTWEGKVVISRPQIGYTVVVTTLSWESLDE